MQIKSRIMMIGLAVLIVSVGGLSAWYGWSGHRQNELKSLCRSAAVGRRWQELDQLAAEWSAWNPSNGEAWLMRGVAANGLENWTMAAQYFEKIPDGDPRLIPGMIELSKLSFSRLNDPLRGVAACGRILWQDPRAEGAHQQLIWFYAMTLQREKLLRQIREAIELGCEPREAYVYYFLVDTFRSGGAVRQNEKWIETYPDGEAFQVARVLQMSDREAGTSETITDSVTIVKAGPEPTATKTELVTQLLQRFPHNLGLLAYKAEECLKSGDVASATELLAAAPASARDDSRFWRIRGWVNELNGEFDAAAKDYHQALARHPLDWNAMNRLAVVERSRKNSAEVERLNQLYEQAQSLRRDLQKLTAVEIVPPRVLQDLARLAASCQDRFIEPPLRRRLALMGL